jgi:hypothetical protein
LAKNTLKQLKNELLASSQNEMVCKAEIQK